MTEKELEKNAKELSHDSGEKAMHIPVQKRVPVWLPWTLGGVAGLILIVSAYCVGLKVGEHQISNNTGRTFGSGMMNNVQRDADDFGGPWTQANNSGSTRGGRAMGSRGQVSAVSSTSITVTDSMRGGSVTYSVDSSSKVVDASGNTKAISDITTSSTVWIQPQTSNVAAAGTITITNN